MSLVWLEFVSSVGSSELREPELGLNDMVIKATEADKAAQGEHEGKHISGAGGGGQSS